MESPASARDDAVGSEPAATGAVSRWLDPAVAGTLFVVTTAAVAAQGSAQRVDVAVGPDTPLWGGAALDLVHGTSSIVPPMYPTLLSLAGFAGMPVADAGRYVSTGAAGLASALAYGAVRAAGAGRAAALLAGGVVAVHPDTTLLGLMFQPDALTMGTFGMLCVALAAYAGARSWRCAAALALAASVLAMTREHGVLLVPLVAAYLAVFAPAPTGSVGDDAGAPSVGRRILRRVGGPLLLAVVLHATTVAVRLPWDTPPWRWPWLFKVAAPVDDLHRLAQRSVPPYVGVGVDSYPTGDPAVLLHVERAYDQLMRHSVETPWPALAKLHVTRALDIGGDVYALLLAGLAGGAAWALRERRAGRSGGALLAGLTLAVAAIVPTLVIWSARRHVAVLVPVGAVGLGLGLDALVGTPDTAARRWVGRLATVAAVLALGWREGGLRARGLAWLAERAAERRDDAAFGRAIRAATRPGTLLAGYSPGDLVHEGGLVHLYAERAWASLDDGQERVVPSLAWRTTRVTTDADATAREGWVEVARVGDLRAWRYRPEVTGAERRCPEGRLLRKPRFVAVRQLPRYPLAVAEGCPPATRGFVPDSAGP
jgi:hypothetical protein